MPVIGSPIFGQPRRLGEQRGGGRHRALCDPGRQRRVGAQQTFQQRVAAIARQRLVATVAAERDGDMAARLPRQLIQRQRGRVGEWLVGRADHALDHPH